MPSFHGKEVPHDCCNHDLANLAAKGVVAPASLSQLQLGSIQTRRVAFVDGLLGMFALRPVRCMFCWRRYYWFSLRGAE